MKNFIAILFALLFVQPCFADAAEGLWKTNFGSYLYFKPDGSFSYINYKNKTGFSWKKTSENTLSICYDYFPSSGLKEKEYTFEINGDTMLLNDGKKVIELKKSDRKVTTFTGEIFYRERIQLPPKVEVRYALFKNNEGVPFAIYSIPTEGRVPLPFSFDCVVEETDKVYLKAAIYHETKVLFATERPVNIAQKQIMLVRASDTADYGDVQVPGKYVSKSGDVLYLEKKGLAIIKENDVLKIAHWAPVDRNHGIEITRGQLMPLNAVQQGEDSLVFNNYNDRGTVVFKKEKDGFFEIGKFMLSGTLSEKQNAMYFTDCISAVRFPVKFKKMIHNFFGSQPLKKSESVTMEAVLQKNASGGIELYPLKVENMKEELCEQIFQHTSLDNTYWRLVKLNGKNAEVFPNQKEPHIIVREGMMSGSDGCNNFFLPVEVSGDKLKLGIGGSTLMMCPQGEEQAREFNQTLQKANKWQIQGSVLKLLNNDTVLALFEAVYL